MMLNWLKGKKSYFVATAAALVIGFHALGRLSDGTEQTLLGLLGASGIATMAAKINRVTT